MTYHSFDYCYDIFGEFISSKYEKNDACMRGHLLCSIKPYIWLCGGFYYDYWEKFVAEV